MLRGMSLLRTAIGTVLRRLRQRQGRTLQDVADAAGVSLPYLSEIERGRKEASSEVLAGICRALGIGLPDLLEQVRIELLRPAVQPPRARATRCPGPRTAAADRVPVTARHRGARVVARCTSPHVRAGRRSPRAVSRP